jgi:hypothetical protein
MATIAELLYLFRDGQAAKTIGPEAFQAMISELHLATGLFQDLPSSSAGLAYGRLYLNGDVVQMATGGIPGPLNGNFLGVGTATLSANATFTRVSARSTLAASTSLFADPVRFILPVPTALFVGSGTAALSADPQRRTAGSKDGNFLGSGAAALSAGSQILKFGTTTASGAATISANTAPPLRAGFSTPAGSGALAANVSFARIATSSTLAGSALFTANPAAPASTRAFSTAFSSAFGNTTASSTEAFSADFSSAFGNGAAGFSAGFSSGFG